MEEIPVPRGVKDWMPNEALFRNEATRKMEAVFQRFGFLTIDTPVFESLKVLKAKGGIGEENKLIFEIKDEDTALVYDHTMSLARYVVMHGSLPLPFKRYVIGKAWRKEEPQRGRFREFVQADIDIVGGDRAYADAEILAATAQAIETLNVDYVMKVNSRVFIDKFLQSVGVGKEAEVQVMRAIDSMDKVGLDGVMKRLDGLELGSETLAKIEALLTLSGTNDERLNELEKLTGAREEAETMRKVLQYASLYGLRGAIEVDPSIVRGIDYYTSFSFECRMKDGEKLATIAGGGRYDNLIGLLGKKQPLPAVGVAIGVDRIMDLLEAEKATRQTYADIFVANVKEGNYAYALKAANMAREEGINVDMNTASRNLSNQLSYANAMRFKYAIIIGDAEEKAGKVKLRNFVDGTEVLTDIADAIKTIKSGAQ